MVGCPLSCDELTYGCTRLEYARLCVEVDAALPFVHSFDIESPLSTTPIIVIVEYEWKPQRCEQCKVFDHSCVVSLPTTKEPVVATDIPATTPIPTPLPHNPGQVVPPAIPPTIPYIIAPHTNPALPHTNLPNTNTSTSPSTSTKHAIPPETATSSQAIATPNPSANALLLPKLIPNSDQVFPAIKPLLSMPPVEPTSPADIEDCDSSQDSGNELLGLQHHHVTGLHATICLESKMDSLRTTSATFSADQGDSNEASTSFIHPAESQVQSPPPTPATVKKKKGGRKKKEARGL
ncbi:hypothetical protein NC651_006725 [Populus alba x Populus x berolinensis]|nr:hypothetical protein NC651_006725 [Populus alba x Populus x berolinensis]